MAAKKDEADLRLGPLKASSPEIGQTLYQRHWNLWTQRLLVQSAWERSWCAVLELLVIFRDVWAIMSEGCHTNGWLYFGKMPFRMVNNTASHKHMMQEVSVDVPYAEEFLLAECLNFLRHMQCGGLCHWCEKKVWVSECISWKWNFQFDKHQAHAFHRLTCLFTCKTNN